MGKPAKVARTAKRNPPFLKGDFFEVSSGEEIVIVRRTGTRVPTGITILEARQLEIDEVIQTLTCKLKRHRGTYGDMYFCFDADGGTGWMYIADRSLLLRAARRAGAL